ncbi:terpene synthase family protein [Streptomyces sp. 4.24]|uniref:terpene synthase family protein n=1 Tax=Streptomyces tritrimontium TaxID=3406573 RepID=UPI003BB765D5
MQQGGEVDAETPAPPYPPRRSPYVDRARRHSREWAVEVGILGNAASQWQVWDETEFSGTDLALFAALTHPDARGTELDLFADSYVWSWYLDDLIVERFKRSRDSAGARLFLDRLAGVAADPDRADAGNPAEFALADLVRRTCAGRDQAWRKRLTGQLPNVFDDALWEIDNAATLTHKLMLERLHLFERLVAEATAGSPGPGDTRRYLQGLKDWIAGDFAWHQATTRYRPQTWRHRPGRAALPPLEGLGMAAAELPRRLRRVARSVRGGGDAGLPSMP